MKALSRSKETGMNSSMLLSQTNLRCMKFQMTSLKSRVDSPYDSKVKMKVMKPAKTSKLNLERHLN
jgi:hypothetical protein